MTVQHQDPNHRHNPYYIDKQNPGTAGVAHSWSIPVQMGSTGPLTYQFICQMVEEGLFTISYHEALERMGYENICEVHRDPPGSGTSYYRTLLMNKLGRTDDGHLAAQMQFWVPLPDKLTLVRNRWESTAK